MPLLTCYIDHFWSDTLHKLLIEVRKQAYAENLLKTTTFVEVPQCVSHVKRICLNKDQKKTNTYILPFSLTKIPAAIKIGYINAKVSLYFPNSLRCFRCQRFGLARAVAFVHLDVSIVQDTMLVNIVQNNLAVLTAPMVPPTKLQIVTVPCTWKRKKSYEEIHWEHFVPGSWGRSWPYTAAIYICIIFTDLTRQNKTFTDLQSSSDRHNIGHDAKTYQPKYPLTVPVLKEFQTFPNQIQFHNTRVQRLLHCQSTKKSSKSTSPQRNQSASRRGTSPSSTRENHSSSTSGRGRIVQPHLPIPTSNKLGGLEHMDITPESYPRSRSISPISPPCGSS